MAFEDDDLYQWLSKMMIMSFEDESVGKEQSGLGTIGEQRMNYIHKRNLKMVPACNTDDST